MKCVSAVNKSYGDLYNKLGKFAFSPYSWRINHEEDACIALLVSLFFEIPIKLMLSPILLPATAITFSLAVLSMLLIALTQPFALIGAVIIDAIKPIEHTAPALA